MSPEFSFDSLMELVRIEQKIYQRLNLNENYTNAYKLTNKFHFSLIEVMIYSIKSKYNIAIFASASVTETTQNRDNFQFVTNFIANNIR